MDDAQIVALYWRRDESAISATAEKYDCYCSSIARRILSDAGEVEECLNDTWLHAWNAIPPHRPQRLAVFLGKITRDLAFDRYRASHRRKRGGGELPLALEELGEVTGSAPFCTSSRSSSGRSSSGAILSFGRSRNWQASFPWEKAVSS